MDIREDQHVLVHFQCCQLRNHAHVKVIVLSVADEPVNSDGSSNIESSQVQPPSEVHLTCIVVWGVTHLVLHERELSQPQWQERVPASSSH
jgi:hypothetical protein